jgi:hypothetical protein
MWPGGRLGYPHLIELFVSELCEKAHWLAISLGNAAWGIQPASGAERMIAKS